MKYYEYLFTRFLYNIFLLPKHKFNINVSVTKKTFESVTVSNLANGMYIHERIIPLFSKDTNDSL